MSVESEKESHPRTCVQLLAGYRKVYKALKALRALRTGRRAIRVPVYSYLAAIEPYLRYIYFV